MTKEVCPEQYCHQGMVICDLYGCYLGSAKCSSCDYHGQIVCPKCQGSGVGERGSLYTGCEECGGSGVGESLSQIRRGSGKVDCRVRDCNGGQIPCARCHGKGRVMHKLCNGTGFVDV